MIWKILLAALVASIAWFVVAGALYMNPFVAKISRSAKSAAVKKMGGTKEMIAMYLLGCLLPSIIFAFAFAFVRTSLFGSWLMDALAFGFILVGIKIIPRMVDMALLTTYPKKLLMVDLVNGSIASFVIAAVLSLML